VSDTVPDTMPAKPFEVNVVPVQSSFVGGLIDDISTLGEPVPPLHGALEKDSTVGDSVTTMDYDYAKTCLLDKSVSSSGGALGDGTNLYAWSLAQSQTLFSEEASFEAQFRGERMPKKEEFYDVLVPPGKLGISIDTPDEGPPRFHVIKDSSCVMGKIKIGDKLLAVNDKDVRAMTAIRVSKMISEQSDIERKLSISREIW